MRLRGWSTTSAGVARRRAVASPTMPGRALGLNPSPSRANSNQETGKVEDHDKHQARQRAAQARQVRSRSRRPAVARNCSPTAAQCRPRESEPRRSTRPPLRLPHTVARLAETSAGIRRQSRTRRDGGLAWREECMTLQDVGRTHRSEPYPTYEHKPRRQRWHTSRSRPTPPGPIMLQERVVPSDIESEVFRAHLLERLRWAVEDAHSTPSAGQAR